MTAILAAILALVISRIASWFLVYRHQSYKKISTKYNQVIERQRILTKRNKQADLVGRESNPAKTEYQANITQAHVLKKQVFQIKLPALCATTLIMLAFGYLIQMAYKNKPVATIPLDKERNCTATFLYGLCFLVLHKQVSTGLGQRVRGTFRPDQNILPVPISTRFTTLPLLKMIGSVLNLVFVYKVLKKFTSLKYVIDISRIASRITGYICKLYVPHIFRKSYFGLFAMMYGVKIEEAERDSFDQYTTFTDFFTRTLKPSVRPIFQPDDISSIVSPCDGRVLTVGEVSTADSTIDCVKGRSYRLDEFMLGYIGDPEDPEDSVSKIENSKNNPSVQGLLDKVKSKGNSLYYMVIYLSPGDYHRFHSPAIHTADYRRHIAGYLAPVKPSYVEKHRDVFKNNERVNIFGEWRGEEEDFFFTSFVGALNVGSIVLDFDEDVVTNQACPASPYYEDKVYNQEVSSPLSRYLDAPKSSEGTINFAKGEMTGRFEMGSTIVLVYEAPPETTKTLIQEGDKVTLGQPIVLTKEIEDQDLFTQQ